MLKFTAIILSLIFLSGCSSEMSKSDDKYSSSSNLIIEDNSNLNEVVKNLPDDKNSEDYKEGFENGYAEGLIDGKK